MATTNPIGNKFLSFDLDGQEYAIAIEHVQEIIGLLPITPVPGRAHYFSGVVNLRGKIVPIIDLRRRLGMAPFEAGDQSCVIVVTAHGSVTGVLVDRVGEVGAIAREEIQAVPGDFDAGARQVLGIATYGETSRVLLDVERVLDAETM